MAKEEGTRAGKEAAKDIDIGAILKEAVSEAVAAAEAQASDMKAFESMGGEIAENAGKIAGQEAGKASGALAGEKVALEAVMQKAIEATPHSRSLAHALRVPPEMLVRLPPSDAVEPAVADASGDGGRFPINAVAVSSRMVSSQL